MQTINKNWKRNNNNKHCIKVMKIKMAKLLNLYLKLNKNYTNKDTNSNY